MDEGDVQTLTMGFTIRLDRDVSKGEMVRVCREIGEVLGTGNEVRPSAGKGLEWARWAGVGGGKSLRLAMHKRWRTERVPWPQEVPADVMGVWDGDESVCVREGWYRTQLLSYGGAPRWKRDELEAMRGVMMRNGWRVSGVGSVRGMLKKTAGKAERRANDYRYFEQSF